ncbi:hypothetical protein, partial [Escherichia sp. 11.1597]|uniref:hypothetical protein n=1 Tax=Escherichia sp. 11.1597 TaxID=2723296 RepID=UPI001A9260C9
SRRDSIKAALSCEAQTMPGDSMQVIAMLQTETIFHTVILLIKIYGKTVNAEGMWYSERIFIIGSIGFICAQIYRNNR